MKLKIFLISGILLFLAGVVLTVMLGGWGIPVILAGFGLLGAFFASSFRIGGYRAEGAFFQGLEGKGRQQSEVSKRNDPVSGEEISNIWDAVEGNP